MNCKYVKEPNESDLDYAMRLIDIKKEEKPSDLDWQDIVDLLGLDLNRDSLRKSQDTEFGGIAVYKQLMKKIAEMPKSNVADNYSKGINVQLEELKKERMKLNDERTALNKLLREEARKEDLLKIIQDCANKNQVDKYFENIEFNVPDNKSDNVALLTLSDFHFGLEINEFNNTYNEDIFRERINKLLTKTVEYLQLNKIVKIYVLGLGDYLSGVIHTINRVESRETIVGQVVKVSEYLFQFLSILSKCAEVYYYDINDNHGRIFAAKDECGNNDNFSLFIRWYLEAKFANEDKVHIMQNTISNDIGVIEILGKNYAFTHGHRDKMENIVQNLSLMTKKFFDGIFTAHCHHFEANEIHGTYVYMNGTLSGTDVYANNIRRTSNPSQNLFILNEEQGIVCQYLIRL